MTLSEAVKRVQTTPDEKLNMALAYLPEINRGRVSISPLGHRYGTSRGDNIYVDSDTVSTHHPLFIAAIIYHEDVHSRQPKEWTPQRKETDARVKTTLWASMAAKTPEEKRVVAIIYKEMS